MLGKQFNDDGDFVPPETYGAKSVFAVLDRAADGASARQQGSARLVVEGDLGDVLGACMRL